jgi:hypothetical protein
MPTSYYGLGTTAASASNADNLTATGGGSSVGFTPGIETFDFAGYMQLISHGGTTTVAGQINPPNGRGWVLDNASLEGVTVPGGVWKVLETFKSSAATAHGDLTARLWDRDLNGDNYVEIGEVTLSGVDITAAGVAFEFDTSSLGAFTFGGAGHKLYVDFWWHQLSGGSPANLISAAVASTSQGVPGASGGFEVQAPSAGGTVNGSATIGGTSGGLIAAGSRLVAGSATAGGTAGGILAAGSRIARGSATLGGTIGGIAAAGSRIARGIVTLGGNQGGIAAAGSRIARGSATLGGSPGGLSIFQAPSTLIHGAGIAATARDGGAPIVAAGPNRAAVSPAAATQAPTIGGTTRL